jgi:hypothetical protein
MFTCQTNRVKWKEIKMANSLSTHRKCCNAYQPLKISKFLINPYFLSFVP